MYYWGQWPYGSAYWFRSLPAGVPVADSQEITNLQQRFEELQNEWQEIRAKVLEWETKFNVVSTRNQVIGEEKGLALLKGLHEQIASLRNEQITAYEELLNKFLTHQMSDRIREIQKDISPGKIVEQISVERA